MISITQEEMSFSRKISERIEVVHCVTVCQEERHPTTLQNKAFRQRKLLVFFVVVANGLINHFPQLKKKRALSYKSSACNPGTKASSPRIHLAVKMGENNARREGQNW